MSTPALLEASWHLSWDLAIAREAPPPNLWLAVANAAGHHIGVPKGAIAEYLDLTSFLARHLRNRPVIDRLMEATNMSEFLETFAEL